MSETPSRGLTAALAVLRKTAIASPPLSRRTRRAGATFSPVEPVWVFLAERRLAAKTPFMRGWILGCKIYTCLRLTFFADDCGR